MSRRFCVIAALVCACGGSSSTVSPGQVDVPTRDAGGGGPGDGGTASDGSIKGGPKTPVPAMAFIVNKIFLSETDRAGVKNKDAWKAYGRNIDDLVTTVTDPSSTDL